MLEVLFWIVASVIGLALVMVLVLLCTPLYLEARFDTNAKKKAEVRVAVLNGKVNIPMSGGRTPKKKKLKQKTHKKKPMRVRLPGNWKLIFSEAFKLLPRLISKIKIDKLRAKVGFGFPDPADTGVLYGMTFPLVMWADSRGRGDFVLEPDFAEPRLDAIGDINTHFTPVALLVPFVRFGWAAFAAPKLKRSFA